MHYQRRRVRIPVSIPVILTTVLDSMAGTIVDLTEDGARIACIGVNSGERLQIEYRGQTVYARCRWAEVDRIGVTFPFSLGSGPLLDQLEMARMAMIPVAERPVFAAPALAGFGRRTSAGR